MGQGRLHPAAPGCLWCPQLVWCLHKILLGGLAALGTGTSSALGCRAVSHRNVNTHPMGDGLYGNHVALSWLLSMSPAYDR